jgi:hypothetical protein
VEEDTSKIDPKEIIFQVLGGAVGPFEIEIDEILLHNSWAPNMAVADSYRTAKGRVFLAGDSGKPARLILVLQILVKGPLLEVLGHITSNRSHH